MIVKTLSGIGSYRKTLYPQIRMIMASVGCWLLLSRTAPQLCASTLEIKGVITATVYDGARIVNKTSDWFIATIGEHEIRIRTDGLGNSNITYYEYGAIGQDSYLLLMHDTNRTMTSAVQVRDGIAKTIEFKTPVKPANAAEIFLNNGAVPQTGNDPLTSAWLAYGFGTCFKEKGGKPLRLSPIYALGEDFFEHGGLSDIYYKLNGSPPFPLEALSECVDAEAFRRLQLTSHFTAIFTNATYKVLNWTNIGTLAIAQHFEAVRYFPDPSQADPNSQRVVLDGVADRFETNAPAPPAFEIPKSTRVVERRAERVSSHAGVAYLTKDGSIWSKDKLLANGQNHPPRTGSGNPTTSVRTQRSIVYFLFAVLLVSPLIFIWITTRKRRDVQGDL